MYHWSRLMRKNSKNGIRKNTKSGGLPSLLTMD